MRPRSLAFDRFAKLRAGKRPFNGLRNRNRAVEAWLEIDRLNLVT
jgi:hypothetical protein